jgi:hypothetical protein
MQVIKPHDSHIDSRRALTAWESGIKVVQTKHMVVTAKNIKLGGHKHPFEEKFILAYGSAEVETWSKEKGAEKRIINAPIMAVFEPFEEHALTCAIGSVIIVFLTGIFKEQNIIPAENL